MRSRLPGGLEMVLLLANVADLLLIDLLFYGRPARDVFARQALQSGLLYLVFFGVAFALIVTLVPTRGPRRLAALSLSWWFCVGAYMAVVQVLILDYGQVLAWRPLSVLALVIAGGAAAGAVLYWLLSRPRISPHLGVILAAAPWIILPLLMVPVGLQREPSVPFLAMVIGMMILAGLAAVPVLALAAKARNSDLAPALVALAAPTIILAALFIRLPAPPPQAKLPPPQLPDSPNDLGPVIIISVDTLRADVVGAYGDKNGLTPAADGLAADGVRFRHAFSTAPWTLPALVSMLTGVYPGVHEAGKLEPGEDIFACNPLSLRVPRLAERFRDQGFPTAAFFYNTFLIPKYKVNAGFSLYHNLAAWYPPATNRPDFFEPRRIWRRLSDLVLQDLGRLPDETEEPYLRYLYRLNGRTSLTWIHFFDPHLPYEIHQEFHDMYRGIPESDRELAMSPRSEIASVTATASPSRQSLKTIYEGEVRYADQEVGKIIAALKDTGLYRDSTIVFLSDHGEEFWDHNGFEHGHSMYQELVHVPLIIKLPGNRHAGEVVEANVGTIDVTPTILALLGYSPLPRMQGRSLLPLMEGKKLPDQPYFFQYTLYGDLEMVGVASGPEKLIISPGKNLTLYFNLQTDPHELNNFAPQSPDRVRALRGLIEQWEARSRELNRSLIGDEHEAAPDLSPETIRAIKAMGYVK